MNEQTPVDLDLPPKRTKASYITFANATKCQKAYFIGKTVVLLLLSAMLISFSSYFIIAPNKFVTGGVAGLAIITEAAFGWKKSIMTIALNLPLILIAFFFVKKKFALLTLCNVIIQSIILTILEKNNAPVIVFDEQIFAALAGGIGIGSAVAIAFKFGGSTGGMDIVAVVVQKKIHATSIAWIIFFLNCVIILVSAFVFKSGNSLQAFSIPIIKAATEQFVESKINDSITNGFQSALEFRVITDKPNEMAKTLIKRLGRGVTATPVVGMYTRESHSMISCVINRRQVASFRNILKEVDPDAFAIMSPVTQVVGLGFSSFDQ